MTKTIQLHSLRIFFVFFILCVYESAIAAGTPKIVAGGYHTVALMPDWTVKAWGYNGYGQLGNGTTTDSGTPVTVTGIGGSATAIAASSSHTVALLSDGTVKSWGSNYYGQLGNGIADSSTPVTVIGLGGTVAAIAAGNGHTVALMSDGTVKAWGDNRYRQLGNGTTVSSSTPVTVIGLGGTVAAIAAGNGHTVALMSDGTVKAWGDNRYGQLGNGTTVSSSTPVTVAGLGGKVLSIAAGGNHTVALMSDGTVKAWGSNYYGQLGNGNTISSSTPITVAGLGGTVTAIAAGGWHTMALMSDGKVKAWGYNGDGQLGNGTTTDSWTPVTVTGLGGTVMEITVGWHHTVALMSDGTVNEWGDNTYGQLGNGTTTSSSNTPVTVIDLGGTVTAIDADGYHTVALMPDGTVKAWGDNDFGQLGNGTTVSSSTPVTVAGLGGKVLSIAAGGNHTVALMSDGTVKAWGYNGDGQLGNGFTANSSTPVTVAGLGGKVTAIAAGWLHTVALMSDGTVKAWGRNDSGQLGNGMITTDSSTPVTVVGLGGTVTAIAAGDEHTVALMSDGTVKAWGRNDFGQLGNGNTTISSIPVTVTGLGGTVTAIAAGGWHTVALMSDGKVNAWGYNIYGQLGNVTTDRSSTPVTVTGLGGTITAIAASTWHTVALMSDGTVKAWGYNGYGQLGNGTTTDSGNPVTVTGLGGTATAIAAGWHHTIALMSDGTVTAWGRNDSGQLGNGPTWYSLPQISLITFPVNGVCGATNGTTLYSVPTTNLCSIGNATAVTGTGPWYWGCQGFHDGTNASCSANIQITFRLTLSFAGTGGGSINGGMSCTSGSTCPSVVFDQWTPVTLIPTPNAVSTFGGWSGACTNSSGSCSLTMSSNKTVTAIFTAAPKAMVGTKGFSSLQVAYYDNGTTNDSVIKLLEGVLANTIIGDRAVSVKLEGGYNAAYTGIISQTSIQGPVQIRTGTVRMQGVNVR